MSVSSLLWVEAPNPVAVLVLAHGAGAPMDSEFMTLIADALAVRGVTTVRFEFPYMQRRREEQRQFPPNRAPQLIDHFREVVLQVNARTQGLPVWVGGKSMGGRMASMLAEQGADLGLQGVLALGYPFHPPGKPEKTRIEHLKDMRLPVLICQGTRDPFGKPQEVADYPLSENVHVAWLEGGDHDFKPLKRSGLTQGELIADAASQFAAWVAR